MSTPKGVHGSLFYAILEKKLVFEANGRKGSCFKLSYGEGTGCHTVIDGTLNMMVISDF